MESPEIDAQTLKISNIITWCIALFPLMLIPFESLLFRHDGGAIIIGISFIPVALCITDRQIWLSKEIKIGNIAWPILFYPIYIWKRSKILEQTKIHLWVWLASISFYLIWVFYPILTGGQSSLETVACDLTTQIIREQLNGNAKCKSVGIIESEGKTHYAIAELDNKMVIDIVVTEISGGRIYVEIE